MTQSYNQITGTYDFGSIVRALQAQIAEAGEIPKEYPYNFQGITQAIQDLTFVQTQNPGADIGPSPSMGDVTVMTVYQHLTIPLHHSMETYGLTPVKDGCSSPMKVSGIRPTVVMD